ncbi:MAG: alpha/beta hydrolase [Pseudomonadota bacterium]
MMWAPDRIDVNGASLEVASFGPPPAEAPTIVLLHEGLGCVALWRDFPEKLAHATGFGVLCYSRHGHGRSDPRPVPRPLDYQSHEPVGAVLDACGVSDCVLLGHSDGATMAAVYAGSVSDMRVRGLVLIAPHFFTERMGLDAIRDAVTAYENGDLRAKLAQYHDDPDGVFGGWSGVWLHPDFARWDVSDAIDHWRVPCLGLQGTDDAYGTLAQLDEIEGRIYSPFERVVLDSVGHTPHLEASDQTIAAVTVFCKTLHALEQAMVDPSF